MADKVKVYEETKKKGVAMWMWLVPLLILLGILLYFLFRPHTAPVASQATSNPVTDLGAVYFNTDQATLSPNSQATLASAVSALKANPDVRIHLQGYASSTGTPEHNKALSDERAKSVSEYLEGQGISGNRVSGEGFGEANPAATNSTGAGKADNRRVELYAQKQ